MCQQNDHGHATLANNESAGISTRWVQSTVDERDGPRRTLMPPHEQCPNCHRLSPRRRIDSWMSSSVRPRPRRSPGQRRKPSTKVASNTATSHTLRGFTSRKYTGPASRWGTSPTSCHRSLGRTDSRHCGGTRKNQRIREQRPQGGEVSVGQNELSETGTCGTNGALMIN
jgi:hypothetical protein